MKKPIIFIVDDDEAVIQSLSRDIRKEYRKNYRILATTSAKEALNSLTELKNKGEVVALFLSDQRMPEMLGVEFLDQAKGFYPDAKRILLTAYSDTEAAIKAINEVSLDYYLLKPWNPPEEKLYPVLNDHLEAWQAQYVPEFEGIKIIGFQWSPHSHQIKDFLSGNLIPFKWLDFESNPRSKELVEMNALKESDFPVVIFEDGSLLKKPSIAEVGEKTGMQVKAKANMYDVAIIGAGPAGLAAGVYGGSEGLKTILIEKRAPGGQAGTSSRIENYLGFPKGLSGSDLSRRAITQASRFGIEFLSPQEISGISLKDQYKILSLKDGSTVNAKSVIIATGVDYRRHPAKGIDNYTGAGIYYGAANTEAHACKNQDVYIVGGGNSAGQAAMYLSKFAKDVYVIIRKPDLTSSMSSYLIDQIDGTDNVHVLAHTELIETKGDNRLEKVVLKNNQSGEVEEKDSVLLFIFIGARPVTDWIDLDILRDPKGFIETGPALGKYEDFKKVWKLERDPYLLESSIPGVFTAGDARSGAMNRVASAVGEGSMAIKFIHDYLAGI